MTPPESFARLLCRNGPRRDLNPKHQRGVFHGLLGGLKNYEIVNYALIPSRPLSALFRVLLIGHRGEHHSTA